MPDDPQQDTLEALADLYLSPGPSQRSPRPAGDPLQGPSPIRLEPKVTRRPPAAAAYAGPERSEGPGPRPHLRYHGHDDTAAREPQPPARVEAVVLGNLPGLAGPWLTQYAQLLADREDGGVLVVHVDEPGDAAGEGGIELELVEPSNRAGNGRPRAVVPTDAEHETAGSLFAAALADANTTARHVLVHFADAAVPPTGEARDRLLSVQPWTLICGADEAAIAAADHWLARIVEQEPAAGEATLGVLIMGANADRALAAAKRVKAAAGEHLRQPANLIGFQQQMVPVHVRSLGRYDGLNPHWPEVAELLDTLDAADLEPHHAPPPPRAPAPQAAAEHSEAPDQPPQAPDAGAERSEAAGPSAAPSDPPQPAPADPPAPAPNGPARPDLALLVGDTRGGIPGGVKLQARCPRHPGVDLVLDQDSRLHLLYRVPTEAEPAATATGADAAIALRMAITEMLEARAWVNEHLDLIRLTQRQMNFDAVDPVLHLFTARADLAARLAAQLGDAVKLHLLDEVTVGGQRTWYCTPLS